MYKVGLDGCTLSWAITTSVSASTRSRSILCLSKRACARRNRRRLSQTVVGQNRGPYCRTAIRNSRSQTAENIELTAHDRGRPASLLITDQLTLA